MCNQAIFIIDDHPAIREGIQAAFGRSAEFSVVGESPCSPECLSQLQETEPTAIVVEIIAEHGGGLELLGQIRTAFPATPVIVYSSSAGTRDIQTSIRLGIAGYIAKKDPICELLTCLGALPQSKVYLSPVILSALLQDYLARCEAQLASTVPEGLEALTRRELQIANLLSTGHTILQVSAAVHISPKTAQVHRRSILTKLGCQNNNELLLKLHTLFSLPAVLN